MLVDISAIYLPAAAGQQQQGQHEVEEGDLQLLLAARSLAQLQPLLQAEGAAHGEHLRAGDRTRAGWVQYSTVQYSAVQYSTLQYSAVQYSGHLERDEEQDLVTELLRGQGALAGVVPPALALGSHLGRVLACQHIAAYNHTLAVRADCDAKYVI